MNSHDFPPQDDSVSRIVRELPDGEPGEQWRANLDRGIKRIHRRRQFVRASVQVMPLLVAVAFLGSYVGSSLSTPTGSRPTPRTANTASLDSALVATHVEISAMPAILDHAGGGEVSFEDYDYGL